MSPPLSRQEDALREIVHLGSAQAASMLARLVGDVGVLVEAPTVVQLPRAQLPWLLGGADVKVLAASFVLDGDVPGALWWVLPEASAERLGHRLLRRPGVSGPLSASAEAALAEAANIVASACCSSIGSMLKAKLLPSTPRMVRTSIEGLVAGGSTVEETAVVAGFVSTNAPTFSGTLVVLWPLDVSAAILSRLGI